MAPEQFILTLSCPNRAGIVAAVCSHLAACGGDILEAHQFDDVETRRFFMRVMFSLAESTRRREVDAGMARLAAELSMEWNLRARGRRKRVLLLVSKFDHCLADLLYRWRLGELPMEIVGIISNHDASVLGRLDIAEIPFWHLPVDRETKADQEAEILRLVETTGAELVVLARYMQILSDGLAAKLAGRCINIHHSFLPGFKGAKPYHQAHARGVKLIGATAHFVTADLDEGPIIEQDVERISHHDQAADLVRKGRDIERRVLARAVEFVLDDRVLINGLKTVVFRS